MKQKLRIGSKQNLKTKKVSVKVPKMTKKNGSMKGKKNYLKYK